VSGLAAIAALRGEDSGFVAGISWLPAEALRALVFGTGADGPAESLAVVVRALELDFAFVPADEPWARDAVDSLHDAGVAPLWSSAGVLGRLGDSLGWTETLRLTATEPGALAAPLAEALHDALDSARAGIAAGADAIVIADDLAGATGPLVSPDFALDALVPCYHALAAEVTSRGIPAVFHSDGDIRALLPALARAGFSAVHLGGLGGDPFSSAYTVARSSGLVVLGGIEAARLLEGARHAGVRAGSMALAGGMIVCDDGGLTTAEEVAAYATAVDAGREAFSLGRETGA
jgi:hypothetical protein